MRDLGQRIANAGDTLTPTERRLAELVLSDPTAVAFGTVADLAKRVETSGPSVVRFATKLDFDGYVGLQNHIRGRLTEQLRRPTDRIRRTSRVDTEIQPLSASVTTMTNALQDSLASTDSATLTQMASRIATTPGRVLVACAQTSAAPGLLLADNLRLLRPGVIHPSGSTAMLSTEIADLDSDDSLIAIDFPRYESAVIAAAEFGRESGATVLAVTDGPLSPLASLADVWTSVTIQAVGPFDSVVPAIALVELLVAEVAVLLRTQATARLDRIEARWVVSKVFQDGLRSDRTQEIP